MYAPRIDDELHFAVWKILAICLADHRMADFYGVRRSWANGQRILKSVDMDLLRGATSVVGAWVKQCDESLIVLRTHSAFAAKPVIFLRRAPKQRAWQKRPSRLTNNVTQDQ
jgi:hypothetical protein